MVGWRLLLLWVTPIALTPPFAEMNEALRALQAEDLRVAAVAYRLAVGNRGLCSKLSPWFGFVVHDLRQYAPEYREALKRIYGFESGPVIESVMANGPAERAGAKPGDRVVAIDGEALATRPLRANESADYSDMDDLLSRLDRAGRQGSLRLTVERAGKQIAYDVAGEPGCTSFVQLETAKSANASADGIMISIGLEAAVAARTEDELAVSIAHEMAHNILDHRLALDRAHVSRGLLRNFGRNAREIRKTEDEADLLGLYLMARAGFDITIAPAYWERISSVAAHGRTHANPAERRDLNQAIVAEILRKIERGEGLAPPILLPAFHN
jgi:hypothetical protein